MAEIVWLIFILDGKDHIEFNYPAVVSSAKSVPIPLNYPCQIGLGQLPLSKSQEINLG